jgi:hypothetical protein
LEKIGDIINKVKKSRKKEKNGDKEEMGNVKRLKKKQRNIIKRSSCMKNQGEKNKD